MSGLENAAVMKPAARASALDICEALIWLRREAERAGLGNLARSIGDSIAAGKTFIDGEGGRDGH